MSDDETTTGSGRGGPLGVPTSSANTQPPSADQDANVAVSGGGMVNEDDAAEEKRTAKRSGPSAA
jgi:predicted small lipoprotein YifL